MWAVDSHYRDAVLAPAGATAAVRQVNGNGSATLAGVHEKGNLADDVALGGTALAAVVCFGAWRPVPRTIYIDQRSQNCQ
jgi:hypothetical protein